MRVLENIYLIPGFVNCYLVEREYNCILIDTGMSKKAKDIIQTIKSYCPDKPLKAILITHSHLDHVRGLETLGQLYGSEVIAHKEESAYIMKTEKMPSRSGFFAKTTSFFSNLVSGSGYTIDQIVTNGEVVYGMKVIHLPGHTPGTIALEDTGTRALFCGDIVNTNKQGTKILPPHKGYALDYSQALDSSIKMFKISRPNALLPGHGTPIIEPTEAIKVYLEEYG
ncbi:MBL fold metallo-hydrolase [Candidatus Heimdallarchaeota archaeon]|nr:MAG: MBL fold metallo-hydrolase [Candidatus Heimdallarchaeota archaeon]